MSDSTPPRAPPVVEFAIVCNVNIARRHIVANADSPTISSFSILKLPQPFQQVCNFSDCRHHRECPHIRVRCLGESSRPNPFSITSRIQWQSLYTKTAGQKGMYIVIRVNTWFNIIEQQQRKKHELETCFPCPKANISVVFELLLGRARCRARAYSHNWANNRVSTHLTHCSAISC
jgi:hypothetical protein